MESLGSCNGRFLRHGFFPKPEVIAIPNSLPKRNYVAKEAVSAAWQTRTRQRSERICKPNDAPTTKPRPCVKTMLCGGTLSTNDAIGNRIPCPAVQIGAGSPAPCRTTRRRACWGRFRPCHHCRVEPCNQRAVSQQTTLQAHIARIEQCYVDPSVSPHNGRFLRHRPERSERCLNYGNCAKASPRGQTEKVCRRPLRKNHVM